MDVLLSSGYKDMHSCVMWTTECPWSVYHLEGVSVSLQSFDSALGFLDWLCFRSDNHWASTDTVKAHNDGLDWSSWLLIFCFLQRIPILSIVSWQFIFSNERKSGSTILFNQITILINLFQEFYSKCNFLQNCAVKLTLISRKFQNEGKLHCVQRPTYIY